VKRIEIGVVDPKAEQAALLAWAERADAGEWLPDANATLNFASFRQLHDTLTAKRMELLRFVAQHEGLDSREIARQTHGEYPKLEEDIDLLTELGLLETREGKLFTPFDEVVMHYSLREAA
jgi:predicted transcriptional regulator